MVLWQGLTEGGTAVPVQVTEAGKVVAEGQEGKEGPPGPPGQPGPQGPQGEYGPGDDVQFGSITAAGILRLGDSTETAGSTYALVDPSGQLFLQNNVGDVTKIVFGVLSGPFSDESNRKLIMYADGSITAAGKLDIDVNRGLTTGGEITAGAQSAFTAFSSSSLNTDTQKFVVYEGDTGIVKAAITAGGSGTFAGQKAGFTAEGELYFTSRGTRYKLEVAGGLCNAIEYTREMQLRERVEDKRKPRSTDSVSED